MTDYSKLVEALRFCFSQSGHGCGWCDREFNWFSVDENDFCSMAEKMEAQE